MPDDVKPGSPEELATLFPSSRRVAVLEPADPKKPEAHRVQTAVFVRALNIIELSRLVERLIPIAMEYESGSAPMQLITKHTTPVIDLAAEATGTKAEWLGRLDGGDFLQIGIAVLEVNGNFLGTVADLMFGATGKRLANLFRPDGQTSSSSLPSAASTTP